MPVGRRSNVCTSACLSNSRRTVSPAPPSNSTLSGTTTAARPCCLRIVNTCWRKLSCLLLVLAQKSSRLMMSDSLDVSPASLTMVTLLFLPKGGLVITRSYSPCLPASASRNQHGHFIRAIAPDPVQEQVHATKPGDAVHQLHHKQRPAPEQLLLRAVQRIMTREVVMGGQHKAAHATGGIAYRLAGPGCHHFYHRRNQRAACEVLAPA